MARALASLRSREEEVEALFRQRYTMVDGPPAGRGTYSTVRVVLERASKRRLLVKEVVTTPTPGALSSVEDVLSELHFLEECAHPHIARVVDVALGKKRSRIVLEDCGEDLFKKLSREGAMQTKEVARGVSQLLAGLTHLHALAVCHNDLKPGHIIVDLNGVYRITDFGTSFVDEPRFRITVDQATINKEGVQEITRPVSAASKYKRQRNSSRHDSDSIDASVARQARRQQPHAPPQASSRTSLSQGRIGQSRCCSARPATRGQSTFGALAASCLKW